MIGAGAMLASAMLHAIIGVLTKSSKDRLVFRSVLMLTGAAICSPLLFLYPIPPLEAWRFLIMGMAIHFTFQMAMIGAFDRGDMNLVYPVMRGSAPMLAGFVAFIALGETLSVLEMAGLAIASLAIIGFAWPDRGAPKLKALGFAFLAACMTALYSVNDASGVRATGSALGYVGWFFLTAALPVTLVSIARRGRKWPALARQELKNGVIAGGFGAGSYAFALFAFSIAPVGPMAAMRETSVIFGAVMAAFILKEPFGRKRIILAILLAGGLVLLQAA